MQIGQIRFLEKGEAPLLPLWTKLLPKGWCSRYTEKYRPFRLERTEEGITGILQVQREGGLSAPWRKGAAALLAEMERLGAAVIVPPAEGEFPRERLPFAEGRKLAALFAFDGAAEALRRQGKEPEEGLYLLAGGEPILWQTPLSAMGNGVNRLAIFTQEPKAAEEIAAELYRERGLVAEVFSSPKNPVLGEADAILSCGMEQRSLEHSLKKGAFWLDLAGNRPMLRRLRELRPDLAAAEGFYFSVPHEEQQKEGRWAEAAAFLRCEAFRESWASPQGEREAAALRECGFMVSGFSAFGKRVKIRREAKLRERP